MSCFDNIIMATDSYKVSHYRQYPPKTEYVYSYFESRGGKFDEIVFFGLQYFMKRYLCGPVVSEDKIAYAKEILDSHMGPGHFNEEGWRHILEAHGGMLPISIKAVPEGTVVPVKNCLFTMVNTDPKCYWLTNYLETLLVEVWYPMSVATNSRAQKLVLLKHLSDTGGDAGVADLQLHDFGYRGVSSVESAAIGGAGHLVSFNGTDTLACIICIKHYYGGGKCVIPGINVEVPVPGISIPAAEHSTITSWGRDNELAAFRNMLTSYPEGVVAVVSDSYNVFKAITDLWGTELKDMIKKRGETGGRLVVRPDSGEPAEIVPQLLELIRAAFAEDCTKNEKGFIVLPPYIRLIQGDGISYETLSEILEATKAKGFAAENLVFGSGGALLQKLNRDTQKCAFKCSEVTDDQGKTTKVYKDPITDPGKRSKMGKLTVEMENGKIVTKTEGTGDPAKDIMVEVFRNGRLMKEWSFEEIRARCWPK
eukprot:CAMPEP_0174719746 /NCGR_PEP_ID=MMETSP1094-20130205/31868_1 /TAXON_ID=156173 /ORGANISM="Chrysochromulina brevifilum, Strain UTEX LB 985" /LENGTH=479 /DNA_ID=CAMNT_0015920105 /DNA_START=54 /DNA_END=1493 /DNA_ORIENTATION=-